MSLKKVLLLTYHFPPSSASGSFRLLGFARHLPAAGWQPIVVAPPQLPWEPSDPQLARQVPEDVVSLPVPYPAGAPKVLRALAPNAVWLPRAWRACRRAMTEHRPDAILTSGPPHWIHVLGLHLRNSYGVPWIADFRDPWVTQGAATRRSWRTRWHLFWERKVMHVADAILANAPNATRLLQSTYPASAEKIVTLTNGFDPIAAVPDAAAASGPIRLVHAGELYHGRDPLPLLTALAGWNGQVAAHARKAQLAVIGRSYLPVDLAEEIRRRGLDTDVTMTGQLPYQEALAEMSRAGILVLFDTPGRKIGVPAKLYEYFGAGRPILALAEPDGDVAEVLRDSGVVHRIASPRDAAAIQQALAELVHESSAPPQHAAAARLERYTRANLATQLAAGLNRLTPRMATEAIPRITVNNMSFRQQHSAIDAALESVD
jgi:glycosyltransferase involved in cell wall biosynthesis